MTTRFDDGSDGPEFGPDDPLAVILRPASDHLGPPPGRYEAIRRAAVRRRVLRAAAGAGVTCAVAVLIGLGVQLTTPQSPAPPVVPLAPPPAGGRTLPPTPSASPSVTRPPGPASPEPTRTHRSDESVTPSRAPVHTRRPSTTPTPVRIVPSASATTLAPEPGRGTRR
ncbi:hypothetical protein [Streptomyces gibsoniae]|uniref:Uncharacterized protein n=1 Tax=Streptomyces gibsoniae TaxID=3075529 RepID=A0ABU2TXY6_9ACTN|nr:hypothetical protein [Streptomyces sp. DSM 41699]MDT0465793.1 hypothetical protein [Streptomyces sp. DSM 41699]